MNLNIWLQKNNTELINITKQIIGNKDDLMDLYQSVILQLLEKPHKINEIPDEQKKYYFIRLIRNNYFSKTSPYKYQQIKYNKFNLYIEDLTTPPIIEEEYEEDLPDMDWVYQRLENMNWYDRDLFLLWLELGTFTKVSKETTIPLNSVGKYIKETMKKLNDEWKKLK